MMSELYESLNEILLSRRLEPLRHYLVLALDSRHFPFVGIRAPVISHVYARMQLTLEARNMVDRLTCWTCAIGSAAISTRKFQLSRHLVLQVELTVSQVCASSHRLKMGAPNPVTGSLLTYRSQGFPSA